MRRRVSTRSPTARTSTRTRSPSRPTTRSPRRSCASTRCSLGLDGDPALLDRARAVAARCSRRSTAAPSTSSRSAGSPYFVGKLLGAERGDAAPRRLDRDGARLVPQRPRGRRSPRSGSRRCGAIERYARAQARAKRDRLRRPDRARRRAAARSGRTCSSGCARASATSSSTSTRTPTSPSASSSSWSAADAELVCAVGDVDQGIFGWRGATIHNMFALPGRLPGRAHARRSRSTSAPGRRILDLANAIIEAFERPRGRGADAAARRRRRARRRRSKASSRRTSSTRRTGSPSGSRDARRAVVAVRRARPQARRSSTRSTARSPRAACRSRWTRSAASGRARRSSTSSPGCALLADPGDNIALARLLLGPAYRLSRRDLFFLADRAKDENRRLPLRRSRRSCPYALVDSIVDARRDRRALGRGAGARRRVPPRPGASWPRLRRGSRWPTSSARSRASRGLAAELAASPDPEAERRAAPPREAARPRRRATSRSPGSPTSPASSTTSTRSRSPTRTRTSCARPRRTPSG